MTEQPPEKQITPLQRAALPFEPPPYRAGRPTSYRREFCQMLLDAAAQGYSLTAFAGMIGTYREVLWDWTARFPEFANAVKMAKSLRLARYEASAVAIMDGRVNPGGTVMTIFGLKNADPDEWRDKTIVEHDISDRVADQLEAARLRSVNVIEAPVIDVEPIATDKR